MARLQFQVFSIELVNFGLYLHLPVDETFSHGRFTTFIIINRYVVLPLITLIEVFFLSSVKRPEVSLQADSWLGILQADTQSACLYSRGRPSLPHLVLHWLGVCWL